MNPKFTSLNLVTRQQEDDVFQLISRLIRALRSPRIAIDERHTPRLHARFLINLLSRYKRKAAAAPEQHQNNNSPSAVRWPNQSTPPQWTELPEDNRNSNLYYTAHEKEVEQTGDTEFADFDFAGMEYEEDVLGALRLLAKPEYWRDMMTPGFVFFELDQHVYLTRNFDRLQWWQPARKQEIQDASYLLNVNTIPSA